MYICLYFSQSVMAYLECVLLNKITVFLQLICFWGCHTEISRNSCSLAGAASKGAHSPWQELSPAVRWQQRWCPRRVLCKSYFISADIRDSNEHQTQANKSKPYNKIHEKFYICNSWTNMTKTSKESYLRFYVTVRIINE